MIDRRKYFLLVLCLSVLISYIGARSWLYSFSLSKDIEWFTRDLIMSVPRLIALAGAISIVIFGWGARELALTSRGLKLIAIVGASLLTSNILQVMLHRPIIRLNLGIWIIYASTTLIVATFEEIFFRIAWLNTLKDLFGKFTAMVASSVVFTLFHIQAQQVACWPQIFIFSLVAARLRLAGVSLLWLITLHWLVDMLSMAGLGYEQNLNAQSFVQIALLAATFWLSCKIAPSYGLT